MLKGVLCHPLYLVFQHNEFSKCRIPPVYRFCEEASKVDHELKFFYDKQYLSQPPNTANTRYNSS